MGGDSSKVEQLELIPHVDGGATPTSPLQLFIKLVEKKVVAQAYKKWHYLGDKGFLSTYDFGVYFGGNLVGGISYGIPNAKNIKGLYSSRTQEAYLELTRLALSDACPKNSESRVISVTLKKVKKLRPSLVGVVTYADTKYKHTGVIYRASNFSYLGVTAQKTDLFVNGKPVGKVKGLKYSEVKGEWVKHSRKHLFVKLFN